jgi:F-type H+-transporting ATPase subunit b
VISINITLVFQLVNFLVSLWIINYFIIKPIRGNLMRRRSMVDADVSDAEKLRLNAEIAVKEREEVIGKVRAGIALENKAAKEDAESKAHTLLDESTRKARDIRGEASAKTRKEGLLALKDLEGKIPDFTKNALAKVLG